MRCSMDPFLSRRWLSFVFSITFRLHTCLVMAIHWHGPCARMTWLRVYDMVARVAHLLGPQTGPSILGSYTLVLISRMVITILL